MHEKITVGCSIVIVLVGLGLYSLGGYAQSSQMARHEPHMSAAYGHLEQAKAELDKAAPNKGGHREKAIQLVEQAINEVRQGETYDQERRK